MNRRKEVEKAPDQRDLLISEIFGPTFQGEGASLGQRAAFVRLAGCNLDCGFSQGPETATMRCDTPYSWNWEAFDKRNHSHRTPQMEVVEKVRAIGADLVVFTGGEPLLQQQALIWVMDMCRAQGMRVEVETNGTRIPGEALMGVVDRFSVSPKLAGSAVPYTQRIRPQALRRYMSSGKAVFKFVAADRDDLEEVAALERDLGLAPIWIMPEGTTAEAVLERGRELADPVLERGWNLTTRLHTLLWGDERGR
ncbi:7-carboxy-7-deazaguanine synthase QueE [Nocardiopsis alborubida]|uniref:7-carboxy-7-deazaguanine synthase n=1 Tax=Nocardiopsis alborubida TaxID=146802 RepID=A0A7X6M8E1_9ACTN|nr:7-carboxy-7-deazaguanine synthase QueE [Nocardiopsis alborubida]NKY96631.1 7-carboxy-7-deazaguanine synthase QueE [Nocardiopsis alborubida]